MDNFKDGVATFVMPHWRKDDGLSRIHLDEAIKSIEQQTDKNWHLVIIDDSSPCEKAKQYLEQIKKELQTRVTVIYMNTNQGPGMARNKGIKWAYENNSPIILFLDADDVCHPRRLEVVRKYFINDEEINVVYSTFNVIDEYGKQIEYNNVPREIREILDGHKQDIVQGENAWIKIGTEKNYTNLTSSTAVKTQIAYDTLFPNVHVSEDTHTWLRYGAHKGKFVYDKSIPSLYRIPSDVKTASSSRERLEEFCMKKIEVDTDGFIQAMKIAINNKLIDMKDKDELMVRFYIKLAESMKYAAENELMYGLIEKAKRIDPNVAEILVKEKGIL